jgi:hypothetical protein
MQECATKYAGSVTTEATAGYSAGGPETLPEALAKAPVGLVQKDEVAASKMFEQCLDKKAGCQKDVKKWDQKRKSATVECLKEVVESKAFIQSAKSDPSANPDEHLQGCPDHGVEYCQQRKPANYFEAGMTLEQCTETCLMAECGCPLA